MIETQYYNVKTAPLVFSRGDSPQCGEMSHSDRGDGHRLGAVNFVDGGENITLYGVWEVNIKNEV